LAARSPKVFRKAAVLSIAFRGGGFGFGGVGNGRTGVAGDMGGRGGVTRGPSGGPGGRVVGVAGGGMGGNRGGARFTHPYLAARPGPPRFQGFARPVIFRILDLEERDHPFRGVDSPADKRPMGRRIKQPGALFLRRTLEA